MSQCKIKYYKPVNSSSRWRKVIDKTSLWKGNPKKSLTEIIPNTGGRNNTGRITCRGKISFYRKKYRIIDFNRNEYQNIKAVVERIEYDPNRTAFIALIKYDTQEEVYSYILAPHNLKVGDTIMSGSEAEISIGNAKKLKEIPIGTELHNIEAQAGAGGKYARGAGAVATLSGKEMGYAIIRLPSKETRKISLECMASIGQCSNIDKFNVSLGKAGNAKYCKRKRPTVRGIAKNPVDHPNGGRTNGGKVFTNFTGRVIKHKKTRNAKKQSSKFIVSKRINKKRRMK